MEVGDCTIKGKRDEIIVLVAHLCHPAMVNDDLAGVAALIEIAKELAKKKIIILINFYLSRDNRLYSIS